MATMDFTTKPGRMLAVWQLAWTFWRLPLMLVEARNFEYVYNVVTPFNDTASP